MPAAINCPGSTYLSEAAIQPPPMAVEDLIAEPVIGNIRRYFVQEIVPLSTYREGYVNELVVIGKVERHDETFAAAPAVVSPPMEDDDAPGLVHTIALIVKSSESHIVRLRI